MSVDEFTVRYQASFIFMLSIHVTLCSNPATLSLADLRTMFRVVTVPVALVCAGNCRKEQNVVQKSLGFPWRPPVLSTALFIGVYLADVLEFIQPTRQGEHVLLEESYDLPDTFLIQKSPSFTAILSSQLTSCVQDKRKGTMLA